jgi:RNA polymerase sigma-70 factor (ECF subfamily)
MIRADALQEAGMDATDEALLTALRIGDEQALAKLLERHAPAVYRFGVRMCRDPEDAKDVVQDTLLAAARGLRDFRGGSALSTWLFTIARSFCIKKRRRRAGAPDETVALESEGARAIAAPDAAPDEAAADREIGAALDEAIDALEPMYREVLVLRDVEGLTAPEVANVLGIGVDAVKSRLHRARVAVRERLAPLLVPSEPAPSAPCPDVVPVLSRYLEGEIGADECATMERHVAQCSRCAQRCESLRRTLTLCRTSAKGGTVPPEVQEAVREALRQAAIPT